MSENSLLTYEDVITFMEVLHDTKLEPKEDEMVSVIVIKLKPSVVNSDALTIAIAKLLYEINLPESGFKLSAFSLTRRTDGVSE